MSKEAPPTVTLNYASFSRLLAYFGKKRKAEKLRKRVDAAWASLVGIGSVTTAEIDAAVAAARAAGGTSSDYFELESQSREAARNDSHATASRLERTLQVSGQSIGQPAMARDSVVRGKRPPRASSVCQQTPAPKRR